jgi:hypothetical protein
MVLSETSSISMAGVSEVAINHTEFHNLKEPCKISISRIESQSRVVSDRYCTVANYKCTSSSATKAQLDTFSFRSRSSENDMKSRLSVDDIRDLTNPESEGRIFKWFLHLSSAERSKITLVPGRGAIGMNGCQLREPLGWISRRHDISPVA